MSGAGIITPDARTALSPLPMRAGTMPMPELIALYAAHYAGRDTSRMQRVHWWQERLVGVALQDLSDDHVHAALEDLKQGRSRYYAGRDADGKPIHLAKDKPRSPATINRYAATLGAIVTWSIKRRIAPKGMVHPCRSIEREPEHKGKTRFLSDDERARLLTACRLACWPRLYLLVLMALTTGARKGDLTGLRWCDIDFERAEASVANTKNGDARILPLVDAVRAELQRFKGAPSTLVFGSTRDTSRPFAFEAQFVGALAAARIKGVTFHTLRHSCASMLAANGATLLEIAEILGHRQLQMTKRYCHLVTAHKAALVNRVLGGMQ
jgi:integrase